MQAEVLQFAAEKIKQGHKVVLLTITNKGKGAPGSVGQMMAVLQDKTTKGTVGGGVTEYQLIERSVKALGEGEKSFHFSFDLSASGMLCGGSIEGYGSVLGLGNRLVLFGAGHVAQSIAPLAVTVGFQVTVVDDREDLSQYFDNVTYIAKRADELKDELLLDQDTFCVIATRGHAQDFDYLTYCLSKQQAYLGMIGSVKKVASLFEKAQQQGFSKERIKEVYAPVGLDISNGTPGEIAIAVMAEILKIKNNGNLKHMKLEI